MTQQKHGISIGINRIDEAFFLHLKAVGKLTHADYEIITPVIDSALEGVQHARIKALFDATEMEGWELRAAWDDFRLGLKHGKEFEKIAIYGNKDWQKFGAKIATWFISGEVKFFDNEDGALEWLRD